MNDYLMAVALFGVASLIVAFIYDGEFGDACEACLVGFGMLFGVGLFLRWILGLKASDEEYLHNAFFGWVAIAGWVYLAVVVIYAVVSYRKRSIADREEERANILREGKKKNELRGRNPREYCRIYGHTEDDESCVCSVCGAVIYPERHRVRPGSCICSICRTVLHPERHRMRPGSCECAVCGETLHKWAEVRDDYSESERGDKWVVYYECSVCGAEKMDSNWYPK